MLTFLLDKFMTADSVCSSVTFAVDKYSSIMIKNGVPVLAPVIAFKCVGYLVAMFMNGIVLTERGWMSISACG